MADDGLSRLSDDEKVALIALLKRTIDADRFPLSPRIGQLRGILVKLEGAKPAPTPLPSLRGMSRHGTRQRSGGREDDPGRNGP